MNLAKCIQPIFVLVAVFVFTNAAFAQNTGILQCKVLHKVADKPLVLDDASYKNALGQEYKISMFKYYLGHFCLQSINGNWVESKAYFLVNEENPDSKFFTLPNIPLGVYKAIRFIIGVDSVDNCSGAQTGALDPALAMFWAWNTGYIFLKLEGISPASKSPAHILEYHIGGYKSPANCIRIVELVFADKLIVAKNGTSNLTLTADVSTIFSARTNVNFSALSSVTDFHNATLIANNYASMFSVLTQ
jgi:hypothetical protein